MPPECTVLGLFFLSRRWQHYLPGASRERVNGYRHFSRLVCVARRGIGGYMDQISKKTPSSKCRLFLKIEH